MFNCIYLCISQDKPAHHAYGGPGGGMDSAMLIPPASWAGWGEDAQQPAGDSPIGTAVVVVEAAVGETAVVEVEKGSLNDVG